MLSVTHISGMWPPPAWCFIALSLSTMSSTSSNWTVASTLTQAQIFFVEYLAYFLIILGWSMWYLYSHFSAWAVKVTLDNMKGPLWSKLTPAAKKTLTLEEKSRKTFILKSGKYNRCLFKTSPSEMEVWPWHQEYNCSHVGSFIHFFFVFVLRFVFVFRKLVLLEHR